MQEKGDYPGLDYNVRKRVSRYPWGRLSEIVVSADQADLMGDGLANELTQGFLAHIPDNASNHISLATDSASDRSLPRADTAASGGAARLQVEEG